MSMSVAITCAEHYEWVCRMVSRWESLHYCGTANIHWAKQGTNKKYIKVRMLLGRRRPKTRHRKFSCWEWSKYTLCSKKDACWMNSRRAYDDNLANTKTVVKKSSTDSETLPIPRVSTVDARQRIHRIGRDPRWIPDCKSIQSHQKFKNLEFPPN